MKERPVNWEKYKRSIGEGLRKNRDRITAYLALVLCPVITFYLFDGYTHNPFTSMNGKTQLLNILFYEIMAVMLLGLFRRLKLALMCQSGLFMIIGLVNYYVLNFRSAPIMPWDIFSISTAASVAGNFDYALGLETVLILCSFLLLLFAESRIRYRAPGRKRVRLLMVGFPVILLCLYTQMIQNDSFVASFGLYDKLFTPTVMNKRDGNVVAFVMELEYLSVEKPDGYSEKEAEELLREYETEEYRAALEHPEDRKRPNIIVIMDEAFSDPAILGEIPVNQDYMPFVHSLQKGADNTVTGYLNVSVLGGNTANTEFSYLTGNTMAFLPQGSVAYQQYVMDELPSLASYLQDLSYETVAIHPYYADGWERDRVYPLLGFDRFLSRDDFTGAKKLRGYISDEASFDKIIELYEEKEEGKPLFVFNVTMQNHSGYDEAFSNFREEIKVEGGKYEALSRYLSLLKRTDSALEELISYFEKEEEDTVIVFFGDHQPTSYVTNPVLRMNGIDPNSFTEEQNLLKYKTPYVIWSNFEAEEGTQRETSVNYLAIDTLERAGLPLMPYQNYLSHIREEYPVITSMQVQDKEGNTDTGRTEEEKERVEEQLTPYRSLQYYLLFDKEDGGEASEGNVV